MSIAAYHESLPYIDPEPTPAALAAARALVAAEAAAATADEPSPPLPLPAHLSPLLETELARVAAKTPLRPLDLSRYEAQEYPVVPSSPSNDDDDTATLLSVLRRAHVSSTYLAARLRHLAGLDRAGRNAWLLANHLLEAGLLRRLEAELAAARREVDRVADQRRRRQLEAAPEMEALGRAWRDGVARVLETEVAVEELRRQIRLELESQHAPQ